MRGGWVTAESLTAVVWSINFWQGWLPGLEMKRTFNMEASMLRFYATEF